MRVLEKNEEPDEIALVDDISSDLSFSCVISKPYSVHSLIKKNHVSQLQIIVCTYYLAYIYE